MRPPMATLVDRFELAFPIVELPPPAVERYRLTPMPGVDLELEASFADAEEQTEWFAPRAQRAPESERYLRARCWASEE